MKVIPLSIDDAALALIRHTVESSTIPSPVVLLVSESEGKRMDPEWARAFSSGTDEAKLRELFLKLHRSDIESANWRVAPTILTRDSFPAECLCETCGIVFALAPRVIERIHGGTMELDPIKGLVLRDQLGNIVDLFSEAS